ncbi:zinc finger protein 37 [Eurytemora carolleeae]|uniref:zinc finger protein 37 n=1 Tax=Eurytemora carolleeae TaxID=1294199 RepID=UPI000C77F701|nr:zinc finger protein 37 [Eurytemora carolleeae]|eukprot:XP_023324506.1 zinc finger protein 37-like [Eurytemora affinis]
MEGGGLGDQLLPSGYSMNQVQNLDLDPDQHLPQAQDQQHRQIDQEQELQQKEHERGQQQEQGLHQQEQERQEQEQAQQRQQEQKEQEQRDKDLEAEDIANEEMMDQEEEEEEDGEEEEEDEGEPGTEEMRDEEGEGDDDDDEDDDDEDEDIDEIGRKEATVFVPAETIQDSVETQNLITPDRRNCGGFEENIVLAVKECFFEDEIRCILIKKTKNGKKVKYFNRNCTNFAVNKRVCDICDKWFTNLSAGLPFTDIGSGDIESFLDVKLDVESKYVKTEDNQPYIKQEIVQDNDEEHLGNESWDSGHRFRKMKKIVRVPYDPEKKKRRIPLELKVPGGWICKVPECGKVFAKRKGWLKHDLTHGAKNTCSYCGIAVSKLREHIKRKHPEALDDDVSNWSAGLTFESTPRTKATSVPKTEKQTIKKCVEERIKIDFDAITRDEHGNYVCRWEECDKVFEKKKLYLKHIYLIHEGGSDKRKRKKICDICGNLITANNMKQHVRTVHTHKHEKNFSCEHCGKEFKYRSELTVHLTHHTGEMNFTCTGCAKKFRRAAEARLCEKGHRGIFAFRCHMCDYKTNKKNHLDRHIESHLKATPFACPICGFKSGRKDNLKQHIEKRHCSANTSIKQLEDMYPDMYKMHETCEAAVIAKTEALAENFARLHDPEAVEEEVGKVEVVKVKPPREDKFGALYEHNKYSIHTGDLGVGSSMEQSLIQHAIQNDISEGMKYQIPEQVEQKYMPPDQQRMSEHERYFQEQRERMLLEQRERVLIEQRERAERDRQIQEQREREHRERMLAEQRERERIMAEQRERERERMAMEMRERVLQEHRERLGTGQNTLAEMYQRMRSLDQ